MPTYKAPLRDIRFLLFEVFGAERHYQAAGFTDATQDVVEAVLQEAAKFCETVVAPLNQVGDEYGTKLKDGVVHTAPGFKEAHHAYSAGQWGAMGADPKYGGQGLPPSLELVFDEMAATACLAWRMCGGLTLGAVHALDAHGSEELKQAYLPKLISAEWSGTMCLTEPQAGSDVGLVSSKAEPNADGSYTISGTKIFISHGDQDITENIVHLVLARLPGAPAGPRGISLFLVPKFLPTADGKPGAANNVICASVEKKMGIKASPTCVLNFEDSKGFLIGPPNGGLACMFTMMNYARLDVALHGLSQAERSLQAAAPYALERLQMRAPTGAKAPDKRADPIIVHPDVRRMLLTQKAITEGCRALAYFASLQIDLAQHGQGEEQKQAEQLLALLIPITKGFVTEAGFEATYWGMQVFGGAGYIRETGVEQYMRDCRIASIYEGTNGIQANDLLRRKVLGTNGVLLGLMQARIEKLCKELDAVPTLAEINQQLRKASATWNTITAQIAERSKSDPEEPAAAAFDYLMISGYVCVAYFWAQMAQVAQQKLSAGAAGDKFYTSKLQTARFYYTRMLPRIEAHAEAIRAGKQSVMEIAEDGFVF